MTRPHRTPVAQNGILGPENPKSATSRSVTWRCLVSGFQDTWNSNKEIRVCTGMLPMFCPLIASDSANVNLVPISFLDADHALDPLDRKKPKEMPVLPYLALEACISFCSVSDKTGAFLFLPCSH